MVNGTHETRLEFRTASPLVPLSPSELLQEQSTPRSGLFRAKVPEFEELPEIEGMSGGSIFGISWLRNRRYLYGPLAIQSEWTTSTREIVVYRMQAFATFVRAQVSARPEVFAKFRSTTVGT